MENSDKTEAQQKDEHGGIWSDSRFTHLVSDPRFKSLPDYRRKVKIDKRFQSMFSDKKFKVKYTVDKYGRRVDQNSEDLKKFYDLETSSEDEEKEEAEKREEEIAIAREEDNNKQDSDETDEDETPKTFREKLVDPNVDYARGEGPLLTDSSLDEESSEDDDDELFIEHVWGEMANDAGTTDESTRRLAACNMDWDRIRSQDIMVLCSSFVPPGGSILSVKIYTSDYGKARLAEEEANGPPELVESSKKQINRKAKTKNSDSEEEENLIQEQESEAEEGDEYHMEKLRQYQLNRLRYYYAVIECDSVQTADKIYQECDGLEYESTATKLDLRFIPDDISFDDEETKDLCTELPDLNQYKPRLFTTTALQQAKVDLTWDEISIDRKEIGEKLMSGNLDEINDADLRNFVAYSSEEEEEEEDDEPIALNNDDQKETKEKSSTQSKKKEGKEDSISKYKALISEIEEKEKEEKKNKFQMEFSWDVNDDKDSSEEDEKIENIPSELTPIEKILKKRSEKNKKRKEERKKKKAEDNGSSDNASDDSDIPDDVDMNDPYFAEEFANGDFIPPKSKKEKTKKKKRANKDFNENDDEALRQEQELQLLLDDDDHNDGNYDGKKHFSLDKIIEAENETKSKRRRKKLLKKKSNSSSIAPEIEDNFAIDINDKRFSAIYSSHLFNIDPTDSHFKKTKGMEKLILEKLKRRHGDDYENDDKSNGSGGNQNKRSKNQIENSLLAKSIKRKIQNKSGN